MTENNQQIWYSLNMSVLPEAVEAIEFAFNELDSLGTEISDFNKAKSETVTVVGYFNILPNDQILQDELHYALRIYDLDENAIVSLTRREIENADWLAEWKKHWKPTVVGRFVIAPPWEPVDDSGKIVIRIEPNMAFGTGTHETTQLCLRAIEKKYKPGDSFLDVGTGTGILAIAAAKLCATEDTEKDLSKISVSSVAKIFACDTDDGAVNIARENARLNGVDCVIEVYEGSINSDTPVFDFVCTNLTLDVILATLPLLIAKSGKTLVLSGILQEQEESIVTELKSLQIADYRIEYAGEWISVTIRKTGKQGALAF